MDVQSYKKLIAKSYPAFHALYSKEPTNQKLTSKPGQSKNRAFILRQRIVAIREECWSHELAQMKLFIQHLDSYLLSLKLFHKYFEIGEKPEDYNKTKGQHVAWMISCASKLIHHCENVIYFDENQHLWTPRNGVEKQLSFKTIKFCCHLHIHILYTPVRGHELWIDIAEEIQHHKIQPSLFQDQQQKTLEN